MCGTQCALSLLSSEQIDFNGKCAFPIVFFTYSSNTKLFYWWVFLVFFFLFFFHIVILMCNDNLLIRSDIENVPLVYVCKRQVKKKSIWLIDVAWCLHCAVSLYICKFCTRLNFLYELKLTMQSLKKSDRMRKNLSCLSSSNLITTTQHYTNGKRAQERDRDIVYKVNKNAIDI